MTRGKAGIDPLGEHFTIEAFETLVEDNPDHTTLEFLTDHDILATVSSEHAASILRQAQLDPSRSVASLTEPERHRLHRETRDTLGRLIEGYHGYES